MGVKKEVVIARSALSFIYLKVSPVRKTAVAKLGDDPGTNPLEIARNISILASSIRYSQATLALASVRNWLV